MQLDVNNILEWLKALQQVYADNKELLTDLDSAIGDADHGVNMDCGFSSVLQELTQNAPSDISIALKTVSMELIRNVGGASGPLYGTFFLRASTVSKGKETLDADDLVNIFQAGVDGIQQRGKAQLNDKTMIDALTPALTAMKHARERGADLKDMLKQGVIAAETGMRKTIPLLAKKGRASYLGERSIGHQDPGATSSYLLIKTAADIWGQAG